MASKDRHALKRLDQPAGKVIQERAKRLLEKTDAAVRRLKDANDREALHDSRVALRRLRSWFQAFRKELPLKGKQRRELRRLAHSTNKARDAEVSLEWLAGQKSLTGTTRFASDLQTLRDESYGTVRKELPGDWHRLSRQLARTAAHVDAAKTQFRERLLASLADHAQDFEQARAEARRSPTPPKIHALRIAGKKLRYLTENSLGKAPVAKGFLREMATLHDSAGRIQDLQRLLALTELDFLQRTDGRYRHRVLSGKPRQPSLAPDLAPFLKIGRAAAKQQAQRIARFRKTYLGSRRPACLRGLHALVRDLRD